MSFKELLTILAEYKILIGIAGDSIRCRADKGVLNEELKEVIKEYKKELIFFINKLERRDNTIKLYNPKGKECSSSFYTISKENIAYIYSNISHGNEISSRHIIPPSTEIEKVLRDIWIDVLNQEEISIDDNFFDLGGDSKLLVQVHSKLGEVISKEISIADLIEYPNIKLLAHYIAQEEKTFEGVCISSHRERSREYESIAIIGMACRFPGSRNLEDFWENIHNGVESISHFSDEDLLSSGVDSSILVRQDFVKYGFILENIEMFDAGFFNISPREAEITDPQRRLFLECAYEALERSGYASEVGRNRIGLFAGQGESVYINNLKSNPDIISTTDEFNVALANSNNFLSTYISYKMNLNGPSINIQTACSTSLVAIHVACQNLLNRECDIALAGGVTINPFSKAGYLYQEGSILSPDGHCRAFDVKGQGMAFSSGLGIVVLKRLKDALADRDNIEAIIKGSAINNDGSLKIGFTAPSVDGQANVIREAQIAASISADSIRYIETHGTGTALGDPIEIKALTKAFREDTDKKGYCAIGSIKTNIGHTDTASGVAGLIKTVLALKHKQIPASLNFKEPNPEIDFENSPFYVNTELTDWESNGKPRRAGVSSFGFGGTNAHVILEEAPLLPDEGTRTRTTSRDYHLISLSAKTSNALDGVTDNLLKHLRKHTDLNIPDVAYSLNVGRKSFSHRRVIICSDLDEALELLEKIDCERVLTSMKESERQRIAFMFSGQGSQYVNMGLGLYRGEKTFRNHIDYCTELLAPQLGLDLRNIIFPSDDDSDHASEKLKQTSITQPALFILEYALARLLISWGVRPGAMIGHSIGEYVAACLSGVFSLEDCLKLVALRGRLIQSLPRGSMLAVSLSEEKLKPLIVKGITIASVNSPDQCTVSGTSENIKLFKDLMEDQSVTCIDLRTSHAFHSEMMEPVLKEYADHVKKTDRNPPRIPFISNVTGTWITDEDATDPEYWSRHIRQTVRFADGIRELLKTEDQVLLEVGPGETLKKLATQHPHSKPGHIALSSIRHPRNKVSDISFLLTTLGKLWIEGVKIDWPEYYRHEKHRRVVLPTYPYERQRFWVDPKPKYEQASKPIEHLTINTEIADWFFCPSWERTIPPGSYSWRKSIDKKISWLVFVDDSGVGSSIVEQLVQAEHDVTSIYTGKEFRRSDKNKYTFNPRQTENYKALLKELKSQDRLPDRIIHCWNITNGNHGEPVLERVNTSQETGFYSLLFLSQALGDLCLNDEIQIVVLSNNMQEVIGEDLLYPEKTTLLGPIRVIPREYPNITCKSVDIVVPRLKSQQGKRMIDFLMSEITDNPSNSIIAYRGNHRWVEGFSAVRLEEEFDDSPSLKEGGVYLITGGLGSMGLAFAKHIAQKVRAKFVLTGRSVFPGRDKWDKWLSTDSTPNEIGSPMLEKKWKSLGINMEEEVDSISNMEMEISAELGIKGLESYRGLVKSLNELCSSYINSYFYEKGIIIEKGKTYNKDELYSDLKILPAFRKLFDFFIRTLEEDNIIGLEENNIIFLKDEIEIKKPDFLKNKISKEYPEFQGLLNLLDHCASNYGTALSEEMKAIGVLFSDGSDNIAEEHGKNTVVHTNEVIYLTLARKILGTIIKRIKNRKLRILEVGAGSGRLTKQLLEVLKDQDIEYYFTDIGKAFINKARKETSIGSLDFMKFGIFDISKDPEEQGYERFSFDIILGLNVVHATPLIKNTIGNLKKILNPDGLLLLVETVKSQRWVDMVWGLAEGWWFFNDEGLRKESPLLCLDDWEEVLCREGFKSVRAYPQNIQKRKYSDFGLIIAQQDPESCMNEYEEHISNSEKEKIGNKILKLKELEDLGSEVIIVRADVSNPEQMQSVVSIADNKFGHIDGVIHTAGILGQGMIYRKTREETERTLSPKVKGTLVLKSLLHDRDLDFFILCSSISSIKPLPGQVDYCAANAFLDAFAFYNTNQYNTLTVSIDWGFWQELGMIETAENPLISKRVLDEIVKKTGLPNAGVIAFDRILSGCDFPQVIVSATDIRRMVQERGPYEYVKKSHVVVQKNELHSRPDLAVSYVAPLNELEQTIAEIMQEILAIRQVGRMDDFFELGGDSLISTQLISRLRDALEIELHPRIIFENPTIAKLSKQIDSIQFEGVEDHMLREIISEVDMLTDLEIEQKVIAEDE